MSAHDGHVGILAIVTCSTFSPLLLMRRDHRWCACAPSPPTASYGDMSAGLLSRGVLSGKSDVEGAFPSVSLWTRVSAKYAKTLLWQVACVACILALCVKPLSSSYVGFHGS